MAVQVASAGMKRVNYRVAELSYAADVGQDGLCTVDIPATPAASATAILNAQSIATAGSAAPLTTFNAALQMGRYGRNISVVASGAATSNVTVEGTDYLGQALKESFTLNGSTPVVGKKAFFTVDRVTFGATAATTINVGTGVKFGVPYKVLSTQLIGELTSDATPTAGAIVAGAATQTLTANDPRGLYTPSDAPDGVKYYRFTCICDRNQLHGSAHVVA